MKIPPIDLSEISKFLAKEGKDELGYAANGKLGTALGLSAILKEWDEILEILCKELIPALKKGGELEAFLPLAKDIASRAAKLSSMASQILSFVPGPIGIVCSLVNAIVCFSSGNILGGLLELLGCIPGAKIGVKGGSEVAKKVGVIVINAMKKNPQFAKVLRSTTKYGHGLKESKVKSIIDELDAPAAPAHAKFDTGRTYNLNFDPLKAEQASYKKIDNLTVSQHQIQNKGINNYRINYGMNPQTTIWPK